MTTTPFATLRLDTHQMCERLSRSLGCHVHFTPLGDRPRDQLEGALRSKANCELISTISDGQHDLGMLHLEVPTDQRQRPDFPIRREVAEVVAEMLNQLATADRRLEDHHQQVTELVELGKSVPQAKSLHLALDQLLQAATKLTASWSSAFFLRNPVNGQLQLRLADRIATSLIPAARRPFEATGPDGLAVKNGAHVVRQSDPDASDWLPAEAAFGTCVPVQTSSGVLGTLWCFERRNRQHSDREVHVMQSVAAQIAAVLERSVLLQESKTQQRLKRELQLASSRQMSPLTCDLLDSGRMEAAWRCDSAHEICGDLCDLFPAGPNRAMIAVGDAVGNSIPAAMLMSVARGALRALCHGDDFTHTRTDRLIQQVNTTLHSLTHSEQFVTLVCGILDLEARTLTYTNAGHPSPVLLRDGIAVPLASNGLLLGVLPTACYERSILPVLPGDVLVFYTDGVTEAMNNRREIFRYEGLLKAVQPLRGRSAEDVADAVWEQLHEHLDPHSAPDDRTLLVVKVGK